MAVDASAAQAEEQRAEKEQAFARAVHEIHELLQRDERNIKPAEITGVMDELRSHMDAIDIGVLTNGTAKETRAKVHALLRSVQFKNHLVPAGLLLTGVRSQLDTVFKFDSAEAKQREIRAVETAIDAVDKDGIIKRALEAARTGKPNVLSAMGTMDEAAMHQALRRGFGLKDGEKIPTSVKDLVALGNGPGNVLEIFSALGFELASAATPPEAERFKDLDQGAFAALYNHSNYRMLRTLMETMEAKGTSVLRKEDGTKGKVTHEMISATVNRILQIPEGQEAPNTRERIFLALQSREKRAPSRETFKTFATQIVLELRKQAEPLSKTDTRALQVKMRRDQETRLVEGQAGPLEVALKPDGKWKIVGAVMGLAHKGELAVGESILLDASGFSDLNQDQAGKALVKALETIGFTASAPPKNGRELAALRHQNPPAGVDPGFQVQDLNRLLPALETALRGVPAEKTRELDDLKAIITSQHGYKPIIQAMVLINSGRSSELSQQYQGLTKRNVKNAMAEAMTKVIGRKVRPDEFQTPMNVETLHRLGFKKDKAASLLSALTLELAAINAATKAKVSPSPERVKDRQALYKSAAENGEGKELVDIVLALKSAKDQPGVNDARERIFGSKAIAKTRAALEQDPVMKTVLDRSNKKTFIGTNIIRELDKIESGTEKLSATPEALNARVKAVLERVKRIIEEVKTASKSARDGSRAKPVKQPTPAPAPAPARPPIAPARPPVAPVSVPPISLRPPSRRGAAPAVPPPAPPIAAVPAPHRPAPTAITRAPARPGLRGDLAAIRQAPLRQAVQDATNLSRENRDRFIRTWELLEADKADDSTPKLKAFQAKILSMPITEYCLKYANDPNPGVKPQLLDWVNRLIPEINKFDSDFDDMEKERDELDLRMFLKARYEEAVSIQIDTKTVSVNLSESLPKMMHILGISLDNPKIQGAAQRDYLKSLQEAIKDRLYTQIPTLITSNAAKLNKDDLKGKVKLLREEDLVTVEAKFEDVAGIVGVLLSSISKFYKNNPALDPDPKKQTQAKKPSSHSGVPPAVPGVPPAVPGAPPAVPGVPVIPPDPNAPAIISQTAAAPKIKHIRDFPNAKQPIKPEHTRKFMNEVIERERIMHCDESSPAWKAIQRFFEDHYKDIDLSEALHFLHNPNVESNDEIQDLIARYTAKQLRDMERNQQLKLQRKKEEVKSKENAARGGGGQRVDLLQQADDAREERDDLEVELRNITFARQHKNKRREYSSPRSVLIMLNIYLRRENLNESTYARVVDETDKQIEAARGEKTAMETVAKWTIGWLKPTLKDTLVRLGQKDDYFTSIGSEKMAKLAKCHDDQKRVEAWLDQQVEGNEDYKQGKIVPRLIAYLEFAIADGNTTRLNTGLARGRAINLLRHLKMIRHNHIKNKVDNDASLQGKEPIDKMAAYFNLLEHATTHEHEITKKYITRHSLWKLSKRGAVAALGTAGVTSLVMLGAAVPMVLAALGAGAFPVLGKVLKDKNLIGKESAESMYKGGARGLGATAAASAYLGAMHAVAGTAAGAALGITGLTVWPAVVIAGLAGFSPELVKYRRQIWKHGGGIAGAGAALTKWAVPGIAKNAIRLGALIPTFGKSWKWFRKPPTAP